MVRRGPACETPCEGSCLRVHDETIGNDEARLCKGANREDGRRGDAARPRDEGRLPDRVAVEFRQSVDGPLEQLRMRMVDAVVRAIQSRILEAEVRAEVDHLG